MEIANATDGTTSSPGGSGITTTEVLTDNSMSVSQTTQSLLDNLTTTGLEATTTASDIASETIKSGSDIVTGAISSTTSSSTYLASSSITGVGLTTSTATSTTVGGLSTALGSNTMAIIAGAAAGGTVVLVIVIIAICLCCRSCRNKSKQSTKESYRDEPRQGPEGGSVPYHGKKESGHAKQTSPDYTHHTPYFVDTGTNDGGYSGTIVHDTNPAVGIRPHTEGQFSLPRPTLLSSPLGNTSRQHTIEEAPISSIPSPTRVEPKLSYHLPTGDQYGTTALPGGDLYQNMPQLAGEMYHNTPTHHDQNQWNPPIVKPTSPVRPYDSELETREPSQQKGKYRKHKDEQIQRTNREASGKYVTQISRYEGSKKHKSGEFSHHLQPIAIDIDPQKQQPETQISPARTLGERPNYTGEISPPQKLRERPDNIRSPTPSIQTHVAAAPAVLPKTKLNKVSKSPVKHEPESSAADELANNPVFQNRKKVIEKECKTIRIKDDNREIYVDTVSPSTSHFVKADPTTGEDEDPYWKIRESRINLNSKPLMHVIPPSNQANDRPVSTVSEFYEDVIPSYPANESTDEEYTDTIPQGRPNIQAPSSDEEYTDTIPTQYQHNLQEVYANETPNAHLNTQEDYANMPFQSNNEDYVNKPSPPGYHGQEDYVNISSGLHGVIRQESYQKQKQQFKQAVTNGTTETAKRRQPSMRASMPPEALSEALDQLFDDATAGSELDLSEPATKANSSSAIAASVPPVLRRKTKIEESKEEKDDRDSWRISRSSFYNEIGADEPPPQFMQKQNINANMVRKGMALSDKNKPFNYMNPM